MSKFMVPSPTRKVAAMYLLAIVTYNFVLFIIAGFDHSETFWISYGFMMFACLVVGFTAYRLNKRDIQPKDWLLGYPVLKHSAIYIGVAFFVSLIFMLLDESDISKKVVFTIQLLVVVAHLLIVLSCFMVQDTILQSQAKANEAVGNIKLMQADIEVVAAKVTDPAVKEAFLKLAEQVRFSDPMGHKELKDIEKQIKLQIENADRCVTFNDYTGAIQCCNRASTLLLERNKKCQACKYMK